MSVEVVLGIVMVVSVVVWLVIMFLNRGRIRQLDEMTMGRQIALDSFPYVIWRATDYGFACTFDICARRTHPGVDFGTIPREIRRAFRMMCVLHLISLACLIAGAVLIYS